MKCQGCRVQDVWTDINADQLASYRDALDTPRRNPKLFSNASSKHPPTKTTSSSTASAAPARRRPSPRSWAAAGSPATSAASPSTPPASGCSRIRRCSRSWCRTSASTSGSCGRRGRVRANGPNGGAGSDAPAAYIEFILKLVQRHAAVRRDVAARRQERPDGPRRRRRGAGQRRRRDADRRRVQARRSARARTRRQPTASTCWAGTSPSS